MNLRFKLCPHWYKPVPNLADPVTFEVTKQERCRICGHSRVHAKIPEPHPTRAKEDLREEMQAPGYELVVEEWLPYDAKNP